MKKLIFLLLVIPALCFGQNVPAQNKVTLSAEQLRKYTGEYRLNDQFKIDVSLENENLYALAEGDAEKMRLSPQSETSFIVEGTPAKIEFIFENAEVTNMIVNMGQEQKLRKTR